MMKRTLSRMFSGPAGASSLGQGVIGQPDLLQDEVRACLLAQDSLEALPKAARFEEGRLRPLPFLRPELPTSLVPECQQTCTWGLGVGAGPQFGQPRNSSANHRQAAQSGRVSRGPGHFRWPYGSKSVRSFRHVSQSWSSLVSIVSSYWFRNRCCGPFDASSGSVPNLRTLCPPYPVRRCEDDVTPSHGHKLRLGPGPDNAKQGI